MGQRKSIKNSSLEWSIFLLPFLAVRLILLELKERGLKFMEGVVEDGTSGRDNFNLIVN